MLQLGNGQQLDFSWCHGFPSDGDRHYIASGVILHWPEPLCVKSMRELHMLCVKLQLKMSCSGGNFLVNSVLVDTNMDTSLLDTTQSQIVTMLNLKQRSLYAPYQIKRSHAQNGLQENGNLLMG